MTLELLPAEGILRCVQLVALITPDQALRQALAQFRKPALGVLLHPVTPTEFSAVAGSLAPLEFRGALVLDEHFHEAAFRVSQRSSLMAQETGTADALTVSYGGLIAEYTLGRAVVTALQQKGWDARGARAVVVGSGPLARAVCREVSSLGAAHITLLAADSPTAERTLGALAASTECTARSYRDPLIPSYLLRADLFVRLDSAFEVDTAQIAPHLSVVDLAAEPLSQLRQQAVKVGATAVGRRDVQAYQLALGLENILGARVPASDFLGVLHSL